MKGGAENKEKRTEKMECPSDSLDRVSCPGSLLEPKIVGEWDVVEGFLVERE